MKHLPALLLACAASVPITASAGTLTTLYTVPAVSEPATPQAVTAFNGKLYGITFNDIFEINPRTGALTTLHHFTTYPGGDTLFGVPPVVLDGKLYGTTYSSGDGDSSAIVYQIDPATGGYAKICDLPPEAVSQLNLTPFRGALYGVGTGGIGIGIGTGTNGTIYRVDPTAQTCTVIYSFASGDPNFGPASALVADGNFLFGTTSDGGTHDSGTLYKFNPDTLALTVRRSFKPTDIKPKSFTAANGVIYGASRFGGAQKNGGVAAFDTEGKNETTLYSFPHGEKIPVPGSDLVSENGLLYGVAGDDRGVPSYVYAIDPANGALSTVFTFTDQGNIPSNTSAGLTIGQDGVLYGTLPKGGAAGLGSAFSVDPSSGAETIVHSFAGDTTVQPSALIKLGSALYGTAVGGGANGLGSIFKVLPGKTQGQTIYSFTGPDGAIPKAPLLDVGGILYGTTTKGGLNNGGTLFSFDPATRTLTTRVSFNFPQATIGSHPALIQIGNSLYGVTNVGNAVFQFDLTRMKLSTLATVFNSVTRLVAGNGLLYGAVSGGGSNNSGYLFQIDPASGALTTLFNFQASSTGIDPISGLLYNAGVLFGFTSGGNQYKAAAFRFDLATSTYSLLHSFAGDAQFDAPPVAVGTKLYAPLSSSQSDPNGAILHLNQQTGAPGTLYTFTGAADGSHPQTALLHINGHFYGTTPGNAAGTRDGTVFSYKP